MAELRDPAIKLFGRTIALPDVQPLTTVPTVSTIEFPNSSSMPTLPPPPPPPPPPPSDVKKDNYIASSNAEHSDPILVNEEEDTSQKKSENSCAAEKCVEEDREMSTSDEKVPGDEYKQHGKDVGGITGHEKILKKPDKILPCPRCNSMDTKFCYYNNYNVNQPRHFCKNCQRYWTAGGMMRNVPVGAGRRKNKYSSSQQRHLMVMADGVVVQPNVTASANNMALPCSQIPCPAVPLNVVNGAALKFGGDRSLCDSMESVLNHGEPRRASESGVLSGRVNVEEPSCASSVTPSNAVENVILEASSGGADGSLKTEKCMRGCCQGINSTHSFQLYPGAPALAYSCSSGWNSFAAMAAAGRCSYELVNGGPKAIDPAAFPWMPPTPLWAPTIPFPFMPAPSLWGGMPSGWIAWNAPWAGGAANGVRSNGAIFPTLGKHSRELHSHENEENTEKSLWVPKTLRVDDPDEAAKSSIWATLGIKPDEGGLFRSFQFKGDGKVLGSVNSAQVLHANPAALSRSQTFQETT